MAQFSMEIMRLTGSVLRGNQHFSEFLAALALMVLAWTIADFRYHFRVRTATIPLLPLTFWMVAAIGILTLATDLWHAEQWYVPRGDLISFSEWQALLGFALLLSFLTWSWVAFIRPQRFGTGNSHRYGREVYRTILKGDPAELAIVADELSASALGLVRYAPEERWRLEGEDEPIPTRVQQHANAVLLLMGDRRFCRAVVSSSPGTILAFFDAIQETERYGTPLKVFAGNLMNEAILNKDSFAYHEDEGFRTGLMGYHRPISRAIFGNYQVVKGLDRLLDQSVSGPKWDASQWEAYSRFMLMAVESRVKQWGLFSHCTVINRAFHAISYSCMDLRQLNGLEGAVYLDDPVRRLRIAIETVRKSIEILDGADTTKVRRRIKDKLGPSNTILDTVAETILNLLQEAATIRTPQTLAWFVQHNSVWGELFEIRDSSRRATKLVRFKVRRLLFDEIKELDQFENYQAAGVLGLLLNVIGFRDRFRQAAPDMYPLQSAIRKWTRRNFLKLYAENPELAERCLVGGVELDLENNRLVRYWSGGRLGSRPFSVLDLDPIPVERKPRQRKPSTRAGNKRPAATARRGEQGP